MPGTRSTTCRREEEEEEAAAAEEEEALDQEVAVGDPEEEWAWVQGACLAREWEEWV